MYTYTGYAGGSLLYLGSTIIAYAGLTPMVNNLVFGPITASPFASPYSGSNPAIQITGNDTFGGEGYTNFLRATNNFDGATNPNKTFRLTSTGDLEIINSAYDATLLQITDSGLITTGPAGGINIPLASSVTSNIAASNYLGLNNNNGQIFSDGNLHIHSSDGSIWLNPLDSSSVRIGEQYNSGSGGGLIVQSNITTNTTGVSHSFFYKVQSGFNVPFDTELALDNLNVRINPIGGSSGVVQCSAVSGSFSTYTTVFANAAGLFNGNTNSGGITFTAGTWTNISGTSGGSYTLGAGGDMLTAHVIDTTNSRIYRITAIHCQGLTGGYIAIERMS
jgi:hypothetical protein